MVSCGTPCLLRAGFAAMMALEHSITPARTDASWSAGRPTTDTARVCYGSVGRIPSQGLAHMKGWPGACLPVELLAPTGCAAHPAHRPAVPRPHADASAAVSG